MDVCLIGLDFGTTTTSALAASANLLRNAATNRVEFGDFRETFRSELMWTPFVGDRLDLDVLRSALIRWLQAAAKPDRPVFGGGALLTGLAAQTTNASGLVDLVREHLGEALVARADDPRFESWLAFMGSCAALSAQHPETPILNLDIGGGTTNLALGLGGEVLSTGSLFVGARHVRVEPGTYRIVQLSRYARLLLDELQIGKDVGAVLDADEVRRIMEFKGRLLIAACAGQLDSLNSAAAQAHVQERFPLPSAEPSSRSPVVTVSGGVGALVYAHLRGEPWPSNTQYGDLGIELAQWLVYASPWSRDFQEFTPSHGGRATVYGLLRHSTQISGATLYLPDPARLPLLDVPILGSIAPASSDEDLQRLIDLTQRAPTGAALRLELSAGTAELPAFGRRFAELVKHRGSPMLRPVVILMSANAGKVFGQYATAWGSLPLSLVVVDEVSVPDARFVQLGRLQGQFVPVSFYGLN